MDWIQHLPSPRHVTIPKLKKNKASLLHYLPITREERGRIHTFTKGISFKWNVNILVQDSNPRHQQLLHPDRFHTGGNIPKSSSHMATFYLSRKLSKLGETDRSRDELISDEFLWTPSHARAKAGRPARTYIQQLCVDTESSPKNQPKVMNDREGWRKKDRDIRAGSMTRWDDIYICTGVGQNNGNTRKFQTNLF